MRFGVIHRLMTNALATLGLLALIASGQFSVLVSCVILAGLVGALLIRESWQRHPAFKHVDTIALLIVIAVQVTRFALGSSSLDVLIEFAAALQVIRLATRRGAAHDQQVIVLALLHLIAGTVLGGGLGYGICFAGVLIVAPGALVLSHLRREVEGNYRQGARDRTGLPVDVPRILRSRRVVGRTFLAAMCLLSVPIFLFTAVLFVFFPRVGLSLLLLNRQPAGRMVGFTDRVDLGQVGVLRQDRGIAMRVSFPSTTDPPPLHRTLHLRGTALDSYDGRAWSQSTTLRHDEGFGSSEVEILLDPTRRAPVGAPRMKIALESIDPPVVFLPPDAMAFTLPTRDPKWQEARVRRGPEGDFKYHPPDERGIKYEVLLDPTRAPSFQRLDPSRRARYLEVPHVLPPRVHELAVEWTEGASTPLEKASAIEKHLREEYRYDLDTPSTRADQPLDHFLFESKRGHCEFHSTAMAILLREVGVPTRNVMGFGGGTYNRFADFYVVRNGDAHSWVEAYIDDRGWMTFDPTPASGVVSQGALEGPLGFVSDLLEATSQRWNDNIVSYDLNQQIDYIQELSTSKPGAEGTSRRERLLWIALGIVVVAGYFYYVRRRTKAPFAPTAATQRTRSVVRATALYESLESALLVHKISRPPGTPPLRHAENLLQAGHPLSDEIHDLTQVYLSARFGGVPLGDEAAADLDKRLRALRTAKLEDRGAANGG